MIRALSLCRYDHMGASSRLRFLQYVPYLEAKGVCVTPAPFFDDLYLSRLYSDRGPRLDHVGLYYARRLRNLMAADRYDVIWLEKEALPWLPERVERHWLQQLPYILDLDDSWFHNYGSHRSSFVRSLLGDKLEALARRAAAVIVGNSYLEAWAHGAGARRVVRLPTVVDLDRYPFRPPPQRETFTIGWIGQPLTSTYLHGIEEVLREMCCEPATSVRLVGADEIALPGVRAERHPWLEKCEVTKLDSFDVGIMPLDGGVWDQGKCGYKIIQYMAAARPVVASRVGANADIVRENIDGILVDTGRDWVDALKELRRNYALRRRMGLAGRARVEERYSVQANITRLAETLRSAAASRCQGFEKSRIERN